MTYCVGLTGNIACGKSTVAQLFQQLNVPIFNADQVAKELTTKDMPAYQKIISHFGRQVVALDNQLNRRVLRDIIFSNSEERLWLENLLHPLIREELTKKVSQCTAVYCLIEIPLLKNKADYPYIQRVLLVTSPLEIQISRIIKRDQCSRDKALAIIATQPTINERTAQADDTLINDCDLKALDTAIKNLHIHYMSKAIQGKRI